MKVTTYSSISNIQTKIQYIKSVTVEAVLSKPAKNVCLSVLSVQSRILNKELEETVEQEVEGYTEQPSMT